MKTLHFVFSLFIGLVFCASLTAQSSNPPAEGFNAAASDQQAIEIADEVMEAMGGREAYDNTRFIRWTFFGRRTLLWDKWTGRVRIDLVDDGQVMLVNIHTNEGKLWRNGVYETNPDTTAQYLQRATSIWINDSYWLVMPYKLKDSGVTLKYLGTEGAADSLEHKLQLTFEEVGDTPDNKYWVMVADDTKLVTSWSFFTRFDDKSARFATPWADYEQKGDILLSGNRGRGQLTDIGVFEVVPDAVFEEATPYDISSWK
ncbi:MAG: hypothetical protein AAFP77_14415 [Bacteroidota bacterium]